MKKDNKIHRLKFFNTIDVVTITEYLESMAEKGYFFSGCTGFFYTFEKGEPEQRKYHVELFSDGSVFRSLGDSVEVRKFAYKWEAKGWRFIYSTGSHVFFEAVDDDAEIIELNPKKTFGRIKGCMKNEIISSFVFMLLSISNIMTNMGTSWPTEFIEYGNNVLAWVILFILFSVSLIRNMIFYFRNMFRTKNNLEIEYPGGKKTKMFNGIITLTFVAGLVILMTGLAMGERNVFLSSMISIVILIVIVHFGIKLIRNNSSNKMKSVFSTIALGLMGGIITLVIAMMFTMFDSNNRVIEYKDADGCIVKESVSDDEIPLTLEDLGVDTSGMIQADTCNEKYYSIYGSVKSGWQNYYIGNDEDIADISYTIVHCNFKWVKEKLLEGYMTDDTLIEPFVEASEEEASLWDAEEVFASRNTRLVVYEGNVLYITNSEVDYTEKVIGTIISKLEI